MFRRQQREEIKVESLRAHLDLFAVLESRHTIWADNAKDPEIERIHREIIVLIQETREKYAALLDKYYQLRS
jgi:hypothetical protein